MVLSTKVKMDFASEELEYLHDVRFNVRGVIIAAHRVMIAAKSSVWRQVSIL